MERNVYAELLSLVRSGQGAVMVTSCDRTGVTRDLCLPGTQDWELWRSRLENRAGPYLEKKDNALTLAELFTPRSRLLVFGGGHIALPLVKMASLLDFEVIVYDDRPAFAHKDRFPQAREVICDAFANLSQRLSFRASDYAAVVTRGHKHDQLCLRWLLQGPPLRYLGMIGSRRRAAIVLRQLEKEGLPPEALRRVHSPIGLDIGAVTPEEISLSILAEMVREKRHGKEPAEPVDMELLTWLAGAERENTALVTVLASTGPTPRKAGAKMAVFYDGRGIGSIGGGCAEADLIREARLVMQKGGYVLKHIDLTDSAEEDGMVCGGAMEMLIEALPATISSTGC